MEQRVPAGAVLLAAGRGSRLAPLTDEVPKPLLPVGDRSSLDRAIDALLEAGVADIVVVTGHESGLVRNAVERRRQPELRTVHNARYADDVNILSTHIGVSALRDPGRGYLIVETDIVMERDAWDRSLRLSDPRRSFWVTHGEYGPELFGGAAHTDDDDAIDAMVYTPEYDPAFDGWSKLLGMVYVGSDTVDADIAVRAEAIERTTAQYYMNTWVESLERLPADRRDLSGYIAGSFNDRAAYERFSAMAASGELGRG